MIEFLWMHLDYVAMAFILLGYFRMGAHKIDGWLWTGLGGILLVIFGTLITPAAMGIAIGNAIYVGLTVRGFIKWFRKGKKGR